MYIITGNNRNFFCFCEKSNLLIHFFVCYSFMELMKSGTSLIVFITYFNSSSEFAAYMIQALSVSSSCFLYKES